MHEFDNACARLPPRRQRVLLIYSAVALLAATLGVGATLAVRLFGIGPDASQPAPVVTLNDEAVYSKVEPGVVDVSADLQYLDETAEGTGFVFNAGDGLVLTNNHVIDGATSVTITPVLTGKSYPATVIGYDLPDDIAVLQAKGVPGLKAVAMGDSASLSIGTAVLALGNEAGQGGPPTIAPGFISELGRSIVASDESSGLTETLHGMLQTSADIRPGDSGGPLANSSGQVVGMDTAAGDGGSGASYAGYAIPIDTAVSIARQILGGHPGPSIHMGMPAFLGALLPDSTSTSPRRQDSDTSDGTSPSSCLAGDPSGYRSRPASIAPATSGALVVGVVCGTPAANAGLMAGDVITGFGGRTITSAAGLSAMLGRDRPGGGGVLTWISTGGMEHAAIVTLAIGPAG
ncbi:MAG TPA: trypsin-like peptidase domain-containing protein [Streptosporangiaceae bacterium]|nr:trypsin-like peptidase domain-containing protein [Streptosporangiaceae bacterium]